MVLGCLLKRKMTNNITHTHLFHCGKHWVQKHRPPSTSLAPLNNRPNWVLTNRVLDRHALVHVADHSARCNVRLGTNGRPGFATSTTSMFNMQRHASVRCGGFSVELCLLLRPMLHAGVGRKDTEQSERPAMNEVPKRQCLFRCNRELQRLVGDC